MEKGRGNKVAPAEYQTFVCSFISNCNMAFQAVSCCFVTQLWSRSPGTADELGSASVRLCPSCPITSINQKGQHKGAIFHKVLIINPNPQTPWSAGEAQGRDVPPLLSLPALCKARHLVVGWGTPQPSASAGGKGIGSPPHIRLGHPRSAG